MYSFCDRVCCFVFIFLVTINSVFILFSCHSGMFDDVCGHFWCNDWRGPDLDASLRHGPTWLVLWPSSCQWLPLHIQHDCHHHLHPYEEI